MTGVEQKQDVGTVPYVGVSRASVMFKENLAFRRVQTDTCHGSPHRRMGRAMR
jgi:hypothetical protein